MYNCIMYSYETKIRVRYSDTDQMGFVYYGVYAQYYEIGRVELLRSIGYSYKDLEIDGYLLPVVKFEIKYKKPAYYDDQLNVRTLINDIPTSQITFYHDVFDNNNTLINTGKVILAFIDFKTKKICKPPQKIIQLFEDIF